MEKEKQILVGAIDHSKEKKYALEKYCRTVEPDGCWIRAPLLAVLAASSIPIAEGDVM